MSKHLQPTDGMYTIFDCDMNYLSLSDMAQISEVLTKGQREQVATWMWDKYHRVRALECTEDKPRFFHLLQDTVYRLDEYKRSIGRQYAKTHDRSLIQKYNDLEDHIQTLCNEYELARKYKPYKINKKGETL